MTEENLVPDQLLFIPESKLMSVIFHVIAVVSMFTISAMGLAVNTYLFQKFSNKAGRASAFHKLCLVKTIPNAIPDYENIPRILNVFVGQTAGFGAYVTGPILELFMSLNRFAALYFATRHLRISDFPITGIAIIGAFAVAILYTCLGFRPNCGFVFYPATFTWDKEYTPCATGMSSLIFYSVVAIATWTNCLNVATAFKLSIGKVAGMNQADAHRRKKKLILMFTQSVIQDCLHVIDLINSIFIFKLSDALWFQFIFLSISFLLIHALDGFVMLYFHPEVHPNFLRGKTSSKIATIATPTFLGDRKITTVE